jgi:hypothetical protein
MRRKRYVVVAATAGVLLAIVGPATPGNAVPPAPVLASGSLPSMADGTVTLSIPDPSLKVDGEAKPSIVVATAPIDASGSFQVLGDASANGPLASAWARAKSENNGWLNLDLTAVGNGNSAYQAIARRLENGEWVGPTETGAAVSVPASAVRAVPLKTMSRLAPIRAGVIGCRPYDQLSAEGDTNTTVGELHTGDNQTAWFRYGQNADSQIEVGIQYPGQGWSVSGSVHVGNNQGAYVQWNEGAQWGYKLRSNFHYKKYYRSWIPGACGGSNYYYAQGTAWNTGSALGDDVHSLDNSCSTSPYKQSYAPNSDFQRESYNATWFTAAASAFGATLRAQSGFSTYVISHWHHGTAYSAYWHCGADGQPNVASRVYSGW